MKSKAAAVFKGHERSLSGRGYIWGRTIPLLKKFLLWGSGPDTFTVKFPQTDYVMKVNTGLNMYQQLPDKGITACICKVHCRQESFPGYVC